MTSDLTIVGQAPGTHPRYEPKYALFPYPPGCAGWRLWKMTGLSRAEYVALDRRNLLNHFPGSGFPVSEARAAAEAMTPSLSGRRVLLLGTGVACAFGLNPTPASYLSWVDTTTGLRVAVVPHPSGRNRWYNDPANGEAARAFLTAACASG